MGLAASQARLLLLTAKNDALELVAQQIENERLILAQEQELIAQEYTDATSDEIKIVRVNQPDGATTQESLTLESLAKSLQGKTIVIADADGTPLISARATHKDGDWDINYDIIVDSQFVFENKDIADEIEAQKSNELAASKREDVYNVATAKLDKIKETRDDLKDDADKKEKYDKCVTEYNNLKTAIETYEESKQDDEAIGILSDAINSAVKGSIDADYEGYKYEESSSDTNSKYHTLDVMDPDEYEGDNEKYKELLENARNIIENFNINGAGTTFQNGVENGAYQIWVQDTSDSANVKSTDHIVGDKFFTRKTFDAITTGTSRYYTENDAAAQAKYDTAMAKVSALDTKLENRLNQVETQKKAVEQEMESVDSIIKSNIERTFKYFG